MKLAVTLINLLHVQMQEWYPSFITSCCGVYGNPHPFSKAGMVTIYHLLQVIGGSVHNGPTVLNLSKEEEEKRNQIGTIPNHNRFKTFCNIKKYFT